MTIQAIGPLRDLVFDGVEESAVVGSPGGAGNALDGFGKNFAGTQILDTQCELTKTSCVERISEKLIVIADRERTQREKRMAVSEDIQIQQWLFGRASDVQPAAVNWILLGFLG